MTTPTGQISINFDMDIQPSILRNDKLVMYDSVAVDFSALSREPFMYCGRK